MNEKLEKLCRKVIINTDKKLWGYDWQWSYGVFLYGLSEVFEKQNKTFCIDHIKEWTEKELRKGNPGKSINTTAPCLALLTLYKVTQDKKYIEICEEFADWCMAQAPRGEKGAFEHSCTANVYPNQIWADTLFMGGIFLAKYSVFCKKRMYMHEALRQYKLHYEFLKDTNTDLIVHGYYGNERQKVGAVWGRGNGWFAAGSPIILGMADESYPEYRDVKENYLKFMADLVKYQNEDGSWNTVVTQKESYSEMSGTAAFAFALNEGIKSGLLDDSYKVYRDKAYKILEENIDEDGTLKNASGGTCIMPTNDEYNAIPICFTPYSQGLAILALNSRD